MKPLYFKYGRASAKLMQLDETIYIVSNVWSRDRGRGQAKGVMRAIVDYADNHGYILRLLVQRYGSPDGKALDNQQLITFYEGFDFHLDVGDHKPASMTRLPSQKKQAL